MSSNLNALLIICILLAVGCKKEPADEVGVLDQQLIGLLEERSLDGTTNFFKQPDSEDLNQIPQDPLNPLTKSKVELGQALFHDTQLGIDPKYPEGLQTYSCASCHHAAAGFQAGLRQGIGEGGWGFGYAGEARIPNPKYSLDSLDVQPVRSPTVLNGSYQEVMLWNGQFGATGPNEGTEDLWTEGTPKEDNTFGYQGLEIQAIAGLKVHRLGVSDGMKADRKYRKMFEEAFPDSAPDQLFSRENSGLAIAAFERTVLANQAPFQNWLKGDFNAMTDMEKEGAILFFGKANCVSCHTGPALNSMAFYALGMPDLLGPGIYGSSTQDVTHLGRGGFTGNNDDNFKFKVPQLYNLTDSNFYGHGGSFRSLREVIEYKNEGRPAKSEVPASQLANGFTSLQLSDGEISAITNFLAHALYDEDLYRYTPISLPMESCFPNADPLSKADLFCN